LLLLAGIQEIGAAPDPAVPHGTGLGASMSSLADVDIVTVPGRLPVRVRPGSRAAGLNHMTRGCAPVPGAP
jgi:hypothetical protein